MKMHLLIIARLMLLSVLMTGLAACGFHLRGQQELAAEYKRVYIQGNVSSILARNLRQAIGRSGGGVVEDITRASAIVFIQKETLDKRVLSVGGTARAREYEIHYSLKVSVRRPDGGIIMSMDGLELSRDFSFNENDILGKEREENNLTRDMQHEAAQIILRRLAYGRRQ